MFQKIGLTFCFVKLERYHGIENIPLLRGNQLHRMMSSNGFFPTGADAAEGEAREGKSGAAFPLTRHAINTLLPVLACMERSAMRGMDKVAPQYTFGSLQATLARSSRKAKFPAERMVRNGFMVIRLHHGTLPTQPLD